MTNEKTNLTEAVATSRSSDSYAELCRLREALPKTEDGVTVLPGMVVWYVCRATQDNPICWSRVHNVSKDMWSSYGGGQPYYIRKGEPFFSTEQLAKEYKARQLREIADKAEAECST